MTFFSKRKNAAAPTPRLCSRCRRTVGSVRLHVIPAPTDKLLNAGEHEMWLCAECVEEIHRADPSRG
jgi:hypothetical protein